jgi:hypothetical protein
MTYKLLSIQEGYNGLKWYYVGNDSTYHQAWPVAVFENAERAQAFIQEKNERR